MHLAPHANVERMSDRTGKQPDPERVERALEGDALLVWPPCHGRRVLLPLDQPLLGAKLEVVCPEGGEAWLLELVADERAESGLRPVWTDLEDEVGGQ